MDTTTRDAREIDTRSRTGAAWQNADVGVDIRATPFVKLFHDNTAITEALEGIRQLIKQTPEYAGTWGVSMDLLSLVNCEPSEREWRLFSFLFLLAKFDSVWQYWKEKIPESHHHTFITNLRRLCNYTIVEKNDTYMVPRTFCIVMYHTLIYNNPLSEPFVDDMDVPRLLQ